MIGESTLLSETQDPLERALLREARDYRASEGARAATLAALGLRGGPPGGSSNGSGGALGAGKLAVGLVVVGVAAAVVYFAFAGPKSTGSGTAIPPMPPAATTATAPVTASIAASFAPPVESVAPPATAMVSVAVPSASAHVPAPKEPVDAAPSLADEILLIDRARSALYDHDKEGSLRALDEYEKRFPPSRPGRMAPEAKSLRERALRLP